MYKCVLRIGNLSNSKEERCRGYRQTHSIQHSRKTRETTFETNKNKNISKATTTNNNMSRHRFGKLYNWKYSDGTRDKSPLDRSSYVQLFFFIFVCARWSGWLLLQRTSFSSPVILLPRALSTFVCFVSLFRL